MKQLTGVDASFLYMESSRSFGHVSGLGIFARPDDPDWSEYDVLRDKLTRVLPALEPLRRRLVEVPLQLDHPYWIEDPGFDLEFHLRESALPAPGTDDKLAQLVARLIGRALDRGHPLWEVYVIEGLSDNRFAILTKLHHATIDGAAGAELIKILFDHEPGAGDEHIPSSLPPTEEIPSPARVLARTFRDMTLKPGKFVRLQVRTLQAMGELTRNRGLTGLADLARTFPNPIGTRVAAGSATAGDVAPAPPASAAPATPFNAAITPHRRVALRSVSLDDIKAIKHAAGTTVNDVVMAACAGALRRYLLGHQALPDRPLVAMVPVSIRTGAETDPWTNRVSAMFPVLPTATDDPLERLRQTQQNMNAAKGRFALVPADVLTEYAEFAPPALALRATRMSTQLKLADRMNPPFNLVISNVPGPRHPLFLGAARMQHYYPISTIVDGQGLNITVQSYCNVMDFGLVSCRELVPDLEDVADLLVDEIAELAKAVGA
ncbi:MAG TPA: wax ester/triacylglycerol synthase family O-acyltransferase [Acidimicrobiales bacterium]|nr:wax ester/triacylglycerol synthase family O-acyltransferase [Acidimicrobiales bacterium]